MCLAIHVIMGYMLVANTYAVSVLFLERDVQESSIDMAGVVVADGRVLHLKRP